MRTRRENTRGWTRRLYWRGLVVALLLTGADGILLRAARADSPAQNEALAATVGVPWRGAAGITETVGQIMARQRIADQQPPKPHRRMPEHEVPRENPPQNPESPEVAQWPPQQGQPHISGTLTPQTLGTSFTGATLADTGAFPPDSMGAVGPTQFVVFVNGRLRTFNKSTGLADAVINAAPDVFFASVMTPGHFLNFTTDPQVRYDRLSERWFLAIIDVPSDVFIADNPNRLLVAVSDAASSGVISGGTVWTLYFAQQNTVGGGDSGEFLDYESLGVDANALYVGGNMFSASTGNFVTTSAFVIRKSSVLSGGPIVVTAFRNLITGGDGPLSPRGVDNHDPASNEGYIIGPSAAVFGRLVMRRVATPGATPSISANILITVSSTSLPIPVDHLGNTGATNGRLDAIDDRLFAAHIRDGRLWTAHNIAVTSAGVASGADAQRRDGARWYELNVPVGSGTPTVVQSGTIFDTAILVANARQYWMPSVMVSGQGHVALGFSTAGTPFRADAATVGRLSGDTPGTTETIQLYTSSSTAYNPPGDPGGSSGRRWGDYSFTSLDPNDDMTMWTIQEFCNSTNSYGVRVVKLIAPPPATPASVSPASMAQGTTGNVLVTGTAVTGSGFFDPGSGFPNRLAFDVNGGGVAVNSVTFTDPTQVTLNLTISPSATTGARTITATNPDGQFVTSASAIFTITPSGSSVTVTGINPNTGPTAGGTPVTITGTNFEFGATVTIGGVPATGVVFVDSGTLDAVTGAHAAGTVDVVVTNPTNEFGTLVNGYTYVLLKPMDFSGDVKTDLVWRNGSTGENVVWLMNGTALTSVNGLITVSDTNWEIAGAGDFNGDESADLLWRNEVNGLNAFWLMDGTAFSSIVSLPAVTDTSWRIVATGDFNGDGQRDIVWRNVVSGLNGIWLMNGTVAAAVVSFPTVTDTTWTIAGAGDFNGDGMSDLVWRNTGSGLNGIWLTNGTSVSSVVGLPTVDPVWLLTGVGDFDEDGNADLVWRNTGSGLNGIWLMNGTIASSVVGLPTVTDPNWGIVAPR